MTNSHKIAPLLYTPRPRAAALRYAADPSTPHTRRTSGESVGFRPRIRRRLGRRPAVGRDRVRVQVKPVGVLPLRAHLDLYSLQRAHAGVSGVGERTRHSGMGT
jgi:hypothetical protein